MIWFSLSCVMLMGANGVAEKKVLTLDGAERVMAAAVEDARHKAGTGVIAIVDDGGHVMMLKRLDGTFSAGGEISIGKARTAAMFKKPTKFFEDVIAKGRTAMVTVPEFVPLQGGIPIVQDGEIVGAIGVSGAASAQQDEEIALAGAAALGEASPCCAATSPGVTYFDKDQVSAAFAKGSVLVDGKGTDYAVHASRREQAGVPEIHALETDIIYVQSGTATLVTGGSVDAPRTIAPDEVRGAAIQGGETRQIAKGDVVIVPKGVPHWFKEVKAPMEYYVVKVK